MNFRRQWISSIVGLAVAALAPVDGGAQTWHKASPGAGGAFTCVDVSANGAVLVGSDVSGLYRRPSSYDGWLRVGHSDGIKATAVDAVKWKPGDNYVALAGTRNGLYRTTDGGNSWSVVSGDWSPTIDVTAIGWSPTSTSTVYFAAVDSGSGALFSLWKSINSGASFSSYTHGVPSLRRIVKILVDPKVSNGEKVYMLSGRDQGRAGNKELYLANNNSTFSLISGSHNAIDLAVDSVAVDSQLVLMTTSSTGPTAGDDTTGTIQMTINDGGAWNAITNTTSTTGAIWFNGGKAYVINVQQDACSGAPAKAGKFLLASSDNWVAAGNVTVTREDDGIGTYTNTTAWDSAWTTCRKARGRPLNSVAFALSARGEWWVTPQFAWRHQASGVHKYENTFAAISGSTSQTMGIDNANPWVATMGNSSSTIWAGYHDLGIWKSTDSGITWSRKNPDLGTWDTYGGNVSSILVGGADTVFAAMAETDNTPFKGEYFYKFKLYRTTDSGAHWDTIGSNVLGQGFIYGLHKNSVTGRMWVTKDGRAYYSDNRGGTWTAAADSLPTDGIFVVATVSTSSNLVLAGGWAGLWRSTDHGSSWHAVPSSNRNFDFRGKDTGDTLQLAHVSWHGIHQILVDQEVWAVSYAEQGYSDTTRAKGIWRSTDAGATFAVWHCPALPDTLLS